MQIDLGGDLARPIEGANPSVGRSGENLFPDGEQRRDPGRWGGGGSGIIDVAGGSRNAVADENANGFGNRDRRNSIVDEQLRGFSKDS